MYQTTRGWWPCLPSPPLSLDALQVQLIPETNSFPLVGILSQFEIPCWVDCVSKARATCPVFLHQMPTARSNMYCLKSPMGPGDVTQWHLSSMCTALHLDPWQHPHTQLKIKSEMIYSYERKPDSGTVVANLLQISAQTTSQIHSFTTKCHHCS